jgi:hypothetical protein
MEIIIGCVVGTLVSMALGVWVTKKKDQVLPNTENRLQQEPALLERASTPSQLPLEKKLRDAIFDCEQHLKRCQQAIHTACCQQLDLVEGVGKKSYVEVAGKPLFLAFFNPISKEKHFYYERDLHKDLSPEVLERTSQLAQQYQQHIDLLCTQQEIFEQLLHSHQENLTRLSGLQDQEGQLGKINDHQEKLAALQGQQELEEKAIYEELLLESIAEELTHQEECMRQYIALSDTYQRPLDQSIDQKYQEQLKKLLTQLELEDPLNPH